MVTALMSKNINYYDFEKPGLELVFCSRTVYKGKVRSRVKWYF